MCVTVTMIKQTRRFQKSSRCPGLFLTAQDDDFSRAISPIRSGQTVAAILIVARIPLRNNHVTSFFRAHTSSSTTASSIMRGPLVKKSNVVKRVNRELHRHCEDEELKIPRFFTLTTPARSGSATIAERVASQRQIPTRRRSRQPPLGPARCRTTSPRRHHPLQSLWPRRQPRSSRHPDRQHPPRPTGRHWPR